MTGWLIFLSVVVLLGVLLCSRVWLIADYDSAGVTTAKVRYLFLTFKLLPKPEQKQEKKEKKPKKEKTKKKKEQPQDGKEKEKQDKVSSAMDTVKMVVDLIASSTGGIRFFFRHFLIAQLQLQMVVAKGDASQTAIYYGQVNAYVYGAYATLKHILRFKKVRLQITPDFAAEEGHIALSLKAGISPGAAIVSGLMVGASFLVRLVRRMKGPEVSQNKTQQQNAKQMQRSAVK